MTLFGMNFQFWPPQFHNFRRQMSLFYPFRGGRSKRTMFFLYYGFPYHWYLLYKGVQMELTNATFTSTFMGVAWEGKHTLPLFTLTSNVQNLTEIVVYKFATGCLFMRIDMSFNLFGIFIWFFLQQQLDWWQLHQTQWFPPPCRCQWCDHALPTGLIFSFAISLLALWECIGGWCQLINVLLPSQIHPLNSAGNPNGCWDWCVSNQIYHYKRVQHSRPNAFYEGSL